MQPLLDLPIKKPVNELSINDMTTNFFYIFNHSLNRNLFLDKIKRNYPELIQVLNKDGTVNNEIKYNSPEYRALADAYVKTQDNGPIKIFNSKGQRNTTENVILSVRQEGRIVQKRVTRLNRIYKEVNSLYSSIENDLLCAVPKQLTEIHEEDPDFKLDYEDGCQIKYPKGCNKLGMINPGAKNPSSVYGKLGRLALSGTRGLGMADAINLKYHGKEKELFNSISDYARLTVVTDDYKHLFEIIKFFQNHLGGLPKINDIDHGKPTYEAIHDNLCWNLPTLRWDKINFEIQFQSKQGRLFKALIDDIFYHAFLDSELDPHSHQGAEMVWIYDLLKTYAQELFSRDCFQEQVPQIENFIQDCVAQGFKRTEEPIIENAGVCIALGNKAQEAAAERVFKLLPELENLLNEKEKNTQQPRQNELFDDIKM